MAEYVARAAPRSRPRRSGGASCAARAVPADALHGRARRGRRLGRQGRGRPAHPRARRGGPRRAPRRRRGLAAARRRRRRVALGLGDLDDLQRRRRSGAHGARRDADEDNGAPSAIRVLGLQEQQGRRARRRATAEKPAERAEGRLAALPPPAAGRRARHDRDAPEPARELGRLRRPARQRRDVRVRRPARARRRDARQGPRPALDARTTRRATTTSRPSCGVAARRGCARCADAPQARAPPRAATPPPRPAAPDEAEALAALRTAPPGGADGGVRAAVLCLRSETPLPAELVRADHAARDGSGQYAELAGKKSREARARARAATLKRCGAFEVQVAAVARNAELGSAARVSVLHSKIVAGTFPERVAARRARRRARAAVRPAHSWDDPAARVRRRRRRARALGAWDDRDDADASGVGGTASGAFGARPRRVGL